MNQELQPTAKQELTPTERAIAKAKQQLGQNRMPLVPSLKLQNKGSTAVEGVKEGEFFVTWREKKDDGKFEDVAVALGAHPEIVILQRLYSYSWYRKESAGKPGRLMAWTNEIESFWPEKPDGTPQTVYLMVNPDNASAPHVEFRGNYQEFKSHKEANYKDRDGDNLLKFKNVLYVYLDVPGHDDKKVFRFFIGNSSVTGVPDGAKTGDYKNPEPQSLLSFIAGLQSSEPNVFFGTKCRLGSRLKSGGIEYYLTTFDKVGPVENLDLMADYYMKLGSYLTMREAQEFESAPTKATEVRKTAQQELDEVDL